MEHIPPVVPDDELAMLAKPRRFSEKEQKVKRCAKQYQSCCGSPSGASVDGNVENL